MDLLKWILRIWFLQGILEAKLEKLDTSINAKQQELEEVMPRYDELKKQEEQSTQRWVKYKQIHKRKACAKYRSSKVEHGHKFYIIFLI